MQPAGAPAVGLSETGRTGWGRIGALGYRRITVCHREIYRAPSVIVDGRANTYLYGVNLILKGDGTPKYYYKDALGSTRALANDSGTVVQSYDYKAFGELLSSSGGTNTYLRFTGQQSDPESSLYYLRARYYDPATGRFMTVDPLPATNLYVYAENRPTGLADPSGMGSQMIPNEPLPPGVESTGIELQASGSCGTMYGAVDVAVGQTKSGEPIVTAGVKGGPAIGSPGVSATCSVFESNAGNSSDFAAISSDNSLSAGAGGAVVSYSEGSGTNAAGKTIWSKSYGAGVGTPGAQHCYGSATSTPFTASGRRPMPGIHP